MGAKFAQRTAELFAAAPKTDSPLGSTCSGFVSNADGLDTVQLRKLLQATREKCSKRINLYFIDYKMAFAVVALCTAFIILLYACLFKFSSAHKSNGTTNKIE